MAKKKKDTGRITVELGSRRRSAGGRQRTLGRRRVGAPQQGRRRGLRKIGQESLQTLAPAGGMLVANIAGGYLTKLLSDTFGLTSERAKGGVGLALSAAMVALPLAARQYFGQMNWLAPYVDGFVGFSGLGVLTNAYRVVMDQRLFSGALDQQIDGGLVSGSTTGVSLLNRSDLEGKVGQVRGEQSELEAALNDIAGPLSSEQEAVYVSAAEHVASIEGPLRAAEGLLENGRLYEAGEAIKDAMSLAIVARALLSGLTAGGVQQMAQQQQAMQIAPEQVAQQVLQGDIQASQQLIQQMPQGQAIQIQDAQTGMVQQVPAPADQVVIQQGAGEVGSFGTSSIALDQVALWAQAVANQNPNWTPSEVVTAFLLKFLSNNEQYYAYGPSSVVAMNNYYPTAGGYTNVGGSQPAGVRVNVGGQVTVVGGTPDEMLQTVSGILERHYGSY